MNKILKRTLIIAGCIVGGFAALFLLLYAVLAIIGCAMYGEYRKDREYVCVIPELNSGFAPQGVTYSEERDLYILTGYDNDNVSVLYIVKDKEYRKVDLVNAEGSPLKGHAGGVTCTKDRVYIANGSYLHVFSLAALEKAGKGDTVAVEQSIAVDNNAAFCFSTSGQLFVGEFYRAGNYETDTAHYFTTPNGEENKAIISCYRLDETGLLAHFDSDQPYPDYCISVTGLVQGFAMTNETFMLSRSYGLVNSALEYHTAPKDSGQKITVKFKGNANAEAREVPLKYLDGTTLTKSLTMPAFSEDITIVGDRVVVTNEASANKYIVGKLFGANKVYSLPIYKQDNE